MTREVIIAIEGLQTVAEDESDRVEVILPGEYYYRNDKHYLLFEEAIEGLEQTARSTIKLAPECMELIRRGPLSTHMVFEEGKKNVTCYNTPYGGMKLGVEARRVRLRESEDCISADILYLLDMNDQYAAENTIRITIRPRERAGIQL